METDTKECLNFEDFNTKYKLSRFLGKGSQGFVVGITERKTGVNFAAKLTCLRRDEEPNEFRVAKRITEYREVLRNVTTLHDCAILDLGKFQDLWRRKPPKGSEVKDLAKAVSRPYACGTVYFVLITDEVSTTMEKLLSVNRVLTGKSFGISRYKVLRATGEIKGYHLFELYYTILRLLEIGIIPVDINPGNVGFVETSSENYNIYGCELDLPPESELQLGFRIPPRSETSSLHLRLIDYGYYTLGNPRDIASISSTEVSLFMRGLLFQKLLTPELDFTKETLGIWNLAVGSGVLPAVTVLLEMAKALGCKPRGEKTREEKGPPVWELLPVIRRAQRIVRDFLS